MNLASRLEKLKQRKLSRRSQADNGAGATAWLSSSTWVLLGLCLALGGVGALAVSDYLVKVPRELVGLWEVEEGPQKGATFEFFRNGAMEVVMRGKKGEVAHKTRVAVRDKTLRVTAKGTQATEDNTGESIIRELTADTLILEEKGNVLKMVRIE
jgi:hypothetical protein